LNKTATLKLLCLTDLTIASQGRKQPLFSESDVAELLKPLG
jgi:hypothetical protein